MEWLLIIVVFGGIAAVIFANLRPKVEHEVHHGPGGSLTDPTPERQRSMSISTSMSVRPYDPDKPLFDGLAYRQFRIEYADEDGVVTERDIYVDRIRDRSDFYMMDCWCFRRNEKRTFRSDRVISARNVDTNRKLKDIRAFMNR